MFKEERIKRENIYKGKIFNIYRDEVKLCDGSFAIREKVEHNGGVCVIIKNELNEYLFVNQFRYGVDEEIVELVAGKLEKGEDIEKCAIREAEEEAGIKVKKLSYLGKIYPTPAYDSEIIHCYVVEEYEQVKQKLDDKEFLNVICLKEEEIVRMISNNQIKDAKTLAFLLLYFSLIKKNN